MLWPRVGVDRVAIHMQQMWPPPTVTRGGEEVTRSGQCEKLVPALSGPLVGEGIRSYALLDFEFLPKHITEPM